MEDKRNIITSKINESISDFLSIYLFTLKRNYIQKLTVINKIEIKVFKSLKKVVLN